MEGDGHPSDHGQHERDQREQEELPEPVVYDRHESPVQRHVQHEQPGADRRPEGHVPADDGAIHRQQRNRCIEHVVGPVLEIQPLQISGRMRGMQSV